jgi:signal transduction histidine kinase/ActR/RegA family two-component response regulator
VQFVAVYATVRDSVPRSVVGLDAWDDMRRREALNFSRALNVVGVTSPITLRTQTVPSVIAFAPVFSGKVLPNGYLNQPPRMASVNESEFPFAGWVASVLVPDNLVRLTSPGLFLQVQATVVVHDVTSRLGELGSLLATTGQTTLHTLACQESSLLFESSAGACRAETSVAFRFGTLARVGNRYWFVSVAPTPSWLSAFEPPGVSLGWTVAIAVACFVVLEAAVYVWWIWARDTHRARQEREEAMQQGHKATISYIAHEVRNPSHVQLMTTSLMSEAIVEQLAALEERDPSAEELRPFLHQLQRDVGTIKAASSTVTRLVSDVLDLGKLREGKFDFEMRMMDVEAIVETARHGHDRMLAPRVAMESTIASEAAISFATDPLRLHQILANALTNAAKYTSAGFVSVVVTKEWRLVPHSYFPPRRSPAHKVGPTSAINALGTDEHQFTAVIAPVGVPHSSSPTVVSALGAWIIPNDLRENAPALPTESLDHPNPGIHHWSMSMEPDAPVAWADASALPSWLKSAGALFSPQTLSAPSTPVSGNACAPYPEALGGVPPSGPYRSDLGWVMPHVVFRVINTGGGLGGRSMAELFEPYNSSREDRDQVGKTLRATGLGLGIAAKLTWAFGGTIRVFDAEAGVLKRHLGALGANVSTLGCFSSSLDEPLTVFEVGLPLFPPPRLGVPTAQIATSTGESVSPRSIDRIRVEEISLAASSAPSPSPPMEPQRHELATREARAARRESRARARASNAARSVTSPTRSSSSTAASLSVAIVDDESTILRMMERLVSKLGHQTTTFSDGCTLFEYLETNKPDIILLDISLAAESGETIARRIVQELESSIPVIACTARSSAQDLESYRAAGFSGILPKPFNASDLRKRLALLSNPISDEMWKAFPGPARSGFADPALFDGSSS